MYLAIQLTQKILFTRLCGKVDLVFMVVIKVMSVVWFVWILFDKTGHP